MITLYHCRAARSFRPLWMLEELELPYTLKMLPFPPRVLAKEYLDVNPLGTIPAFFDGETRMTESAAICEYLAVRYGPTPLAISPDEPDYGAYLNWMHFGEATLTFPQTLVLRYTRLEPEERRQPQVAEDYRRWFLGRLRMVRSILESRDYLVGNRFTAADVSVSYALLLAGNLGIDEALEGSLAGYWARCSERPAFQRAVRAENETPLAMGQN
ncbi:MAG: glutathione S-transferase family protein [Ectothiorhodospiraceae bacterium]|nr:glutathione S-transferase family protein [Ectothiorhodospiraceae bacterium]